MAIATSQPSTNGNTSVGTARKGGAPARRSVRRRQTPLVVVGVLLVVGCALGFADASLSLAAHEDVLVVSQPLAAGHVLAPSDLRAVRVSTGAGLGVVAVAAEASVVGRPVAVPLVAGALLTRGEVGNAAPVGSGADVVAVALKAGLFPPDLAPGDRVQVVPVVAAGSSGPATVNVGPVDATVLAVQAAPANASTVAVFSLQVAKSEADGVASLASAGEASLVQLGAGS